MNDETAQEFFFYAKQILKALKKFNIENISSVNASSKDLKSEYYDSNQIKDKLHISNSKLQFMRKNMMIPFIKIGRKYLYPADEIDAMLEH